MLKKIILLSVFLKKSHANKNLKILNEKENSSKILNVNKDKSKSGNQIWNKLEESNFKKKFLKDQNLLNVLIQKAR